MTLSGPTPPHGAFPGRPLQGQDRSATDLHPGGRDSQHGARRDSDPRQDERFSRALQKAAALHPPAPTDETDDLPDVALPPPPLLPFQPAMPALPPANSPRATLDSIAERITRYIRGAEGGQALRQGDPMTVRLPPNVLGVAEVSLHRQGDSLLVTISLQAQDAAQIGLDSQLALLGQALAQRLPRQSLRVALDDARDRDPTEEAVAAFHPLFPRGRIG